KQKRKNVESESIPQETSRKASKKQKTVAEPTRYSERIARQDSELAGATRDIRISSGSDSGSRSSYDLKDLPSSASRFTEDDLVALNATFIPASNENEVIPDVEAINVPQEYFLPELPSDMLRRPNFNVDGIQTSGQPIVTGSDRLQALTSIHVKTFLNNLHRVVMNAGLDIGTEESKTDTLVTHLLLRVIDFGGWPFAVRIKESYKLSVNYKKISAIPDIVVDKGEISMMIVEDKHLKNVTAPDFGEAQIMAEILACGYENLRTSRAITDQTIFVVRVVSSYVTFYRSKISAGYWKEIKRGLPRKKKVTVLRWPMANDPVTGLDFAEPGGRQAILTALAKIRQFILQPSSFSIQRPGGAE
ncbi:10883_t:CDS:2, partial [Funneliformis caledonium]